MGSRRDGHGVGLACALALVVSACGEGGGGPDAAVLGPALDAAAASDLAVPDAFPPDLSLSPDARGCGPDGGVPDQLSCTGLYADPVQGTLAPGVQAYTPGFQLWTDGAEKARYVFLPPGQTIDVSDPNEWVFPVGTKLWKEFALTIGGAKKKIETRFLWKIGPDDWIMTTYVWDAAQTGAARVTTGMAVYPGTAGLAIPGSSTTSYPGYEIPAQSDCARCHGGRKDRVLGFEPLLLAAPEARGLTYAALKAAGALTSTNAHKDLPDSALQIPGAPAERAALGALHANCGLSCHNGHVFDATGFRARIELDLVTGQAPATVAATSTYASAVNVASIFKPMGGSGNHYRLRPTDVTRSTIAYRLSATRGSYEAMPPVATHAVSDALVATVQAWLAYMTPANGYPAPSPP